jgi:hypothetical protein
MLYNDDGESMFVRNVGKLLQAYKNKIAILMLTKLRGPKTGNFLGLLVTLTS